MSYRERARRRFLERGRVLGMPRPLVLRLWSEAPGATLWPDDLRVSRTRLLVGDPGSNAAEWRDLSGAISRLSFTESTLDEELRRPVAYAQRSGKRSLLDRIRGRS